MKAKASKKNQSDSESDKDGYSFEAHAIQVYADRRKQAIFFTRPDWQPLFFVKEQAVCRLAIAITKDEKDTGTSIFGDVVFAIIEVL